MKLRNKKTGEIGEIGYIGSSSGELSVSPINRVACESVASYNSLTELNEEWEDYEEPKEYWFVDYDGGIVPFSKMKETATDRMMKQIGNYFETKEEAELAVRKLEGWKVLKDLGFKIEGIRYVNNKSYIEWSVPQKTRDDYFMSEAFTITLHFLFGGEE